MTKPDTGAGANPTRAAREKRLAEALRANLRRRKRAARAGVAGGEVDSDPPVAAGAADAVAAEDEAG